MVSFHKLSSLVLVIALVIVSHSIRGGNVKSNSAQLLTEAGPDSARFIISLDPKNPRALADLKVKLAQSKVNYKIVHDLTQVPAVFYGVSVELLDKKQVKLLLGIPGIRDVKQAGSIARGPTIPGNIQSKPLTTTVQKFPPHLQTNISMLHKQGIYGAGVKLAIIDSGIDCTHPAFGGGFGKGKKISFGMSFVENDDPQSKLNRGAIPNPCSDCGYHGTHVAGIVAAKDVGFGFRGVAPDVTLGMYLFGCDPYGPDDVIVRALLQAELDGADIISLSLGSSGGWSVGKDILDVINNLVEKKGKIIVVSAGNDGTDGLFSASSPASARGAISVASVDSSSPMSRELETSTGQNLSYYKNQVLPDASYPVYFTSDDLLNEDDACLPLPSKTPDLANYVVLIKIGSCFISEKALHARAKGAKLIFFYMKTRLVVSMHSQVLGATVAGISLEDAKYIAAESKKNPKGFRLIINSANKRTTILQPGLISPFSSFGPSFDFASPQPAISGIGGNVVSTLPMVSGAYGSASGTSMAAPQLAGIAALILSHRGKAGFDGYTMRDRLTTSSRIINYSAFRHQPHTVSHQGGGLANAWCAVMANTIITNAHMALFDSTSFKPDQEIKISNTGKTAVQYHLTHLPAVSVKTFGSHQKFNRPDVTPDIEGNVADAVITPQVFSLAPGAKQSVKIRFTPPKSDTRDLIVYSGYIILTGDVECESHNVPYYGVVGSLKEQEVLDRGPTGVSTTRFPFVGLKAEEEKADSLLDIKTTDFIWKLREHASLYIRFRTVFGSSVLRMDVIAGGANPSPSKIPKASTFATSFGGVKLIGMIPNGEFHAVSRSGPGFDDLFRTIWDAAVVTGVVNQNLTPLPAGKYRILIRTLRVSGNKDLETDFDFWVSPTFTLVR
ncbi:hypothetical protein PTTG_05436 [Puccinia triticina 1-1 BBBD Race 1]|uniref:Peptidase S8/S53 domain-containing protein n=1 Tax=Puccinia triticina (isolate 1-1 / race 1 (BBBD)) TaxID=630390 RepID=A0A180GTT6_PUCT1|nr:hypothetical protein PTTG_05436 [Puccinia triticina 1-1 BBBD Race 1]